MNYSQWIDHIAGHHRQLIDLGLNRIEQVAKRLKVLAFDCPVIMVTGTNGKGTCVFALEAIYQQAGYKTALFHSPFLYHPAEQIHCNHHEIMEVELCQAFDAINQACGNIRLTEFEWWTLAALWFFQQHQPDVVILEVGMGGREDAVNIIDADIAIITNVELDHQSWLGDTREKIAYQKAGIMRANKTLILGNAHIPTVVRDLAKQQHVRVYQYLDDFAQPIIKTRYADNSIACALKAVELLATTVPVSQQHIEHALRSLNVSGRFEYRATPIPQLWDVGHNPNAVSVLHDHLLTFYPNRRCYAVFSAFSDKAVEQMVACISDVVVQWWIAPMQHPRAMPLPLLKSKTEQLASSAHYCSSVKEAYQQASEAAIKDDVLLLVFGSFALLREISINEGCL